MDHRSKAISCVSRAFLLLLNQFLAIMKALVGGVAEWSNAPVLKTDEGESPPRVRIPVPPPLARFKWLFKFGKLKNK